MCCNKAEVVFEETTSERGGPTDSSPMPFKKLMNDLERQGFLEIKVASHKVTRPSAVMRGEEADRQGCEIELFCLLYFWALQVRDRTRGVFNLQTKPRPGQECQIHQSCRPGRIQAFGELLMDPASVALLGWV